MTWEIPPLKGAGGCKTMKIQNLILRKNLSGGCKTVKTT
jgi:hypothetical protein